MDPAKAKLVVAAALAFGASDLAYVNAVVAPALARVTAPAGDSAAPRPARESGVDSRAPPRPASATKPASDAPEAAASRAHVGPGVATDATVSAPALPAIEFARGSSSITPDAQAVIERAAQAMRDNPRLKVLLRGHADATGAERANIDISWGRAWSVAAALRGKGVGPERVRTEGRGSKEPLASDGSESAMRKNRRTELVWER